VLGALPKSSGSQDLKSTRNTQHIGKNDQKATKLWSQSIGMGWSPIATRQSTSTHRLEEKEERSISEAKIKHDISQKRIYLQKHRPSE
jgi:hypothetical protein